MLLDYQLNAIRASTPIVGGRAGVIAMLSSGSLPSEAGTKMTLEEIARLAGVSRSTVSRVINEDPKVNAATRERVRQFIKAYDFHPNTAARAARSRSR